MEEKQLVTPGSGSARARTWKTLGVLLALGIAVWLFWRGGALQRFNWNAAAKVVRGLDPFWLSLASLLLLSTYLGRALRWAVLLRPFRSRPSIWGLCSATAIGFTAIVILGRAGELVRPYLISIREKVPFSSQIAALLLERIFDLLVALAIFGAALSQVRTSGLSTGPALTWVLRSGGLMVSIFCAVSLTVLFLIRRHSAAMRDRILDGLKFLPERRYAQAEQFIRAFVQGVESTRDDRTMLLLIGYTLLEWILICGCYYTLINSFGGVIHFRLVDMLIFMGFVNFGAIVQIPGVGGGMQVVAYLVLRELFQTPAEVAASIAMLVWAITFVAVVPFGILLAFLEGVSWTRLSHLSADQES